MLARPVLLLVLIGLAPATTVAQFHYLAVADVREVYNSDVLELETSGDTGSTPREA